MQRVHACTNGYNCSDRAANLDARTAHGDSCFDQYTDPADGHACANSHAAPDEHTTTHGHAAADQYAHACANEGGHAQANQYQGGRRFNRRWRVITAINAAKVD
jgi:hypothetical protein